MSKNRLYVMLAGLVVLALFASACGAATPAVDTAATEAVAAAQAAAETQAAADAAAAQAAADAAAAQAAADAAATEAAMPTLGSPELPITMAIAPSATSS